MTDESEGSSELSLRRQIKLKHNESEDSSELSLSRQIKLKHKVKVLLNFLLEGKLN